MEREPQFRKAKGNCDRGGEKPKGCGCRKITGVVEEINYYSDMTGFTRYMKAIRIGGEDYGEGKPHEQSFDGEG